MKNSMIILTAIIAAGSVFTSCTKKADVQSASEVAKAQTETEAFVPDWTPSSDGMFHELHVWNSANVQYSGYNFIDRVWMSCNSRYTTYADGTPVAYTEDGAAGKLYSYYDAYENHKGDNNQQGVCPKGWHLPSLDEWAWTAAMVKGDAGCDVNDGSCLSLALRSSHWDGNNKSGFSIEREKGHGGNLGDNVTGFWFRDGALIIQYWGTEWKSVDEAGKMANLSVRCVKD